MEKNAPLSYRAQQLVVRVKTNIKNNTGMLAIVAFAFIFVITDKWFPAVLAGLIIIVLGILTYKMSCWVGAISYIIDQNKNDYERSIRLKSIIRKYSDDDAEVKNFGNWNVFRVEKYHPSSFEGSFNGTFCRTSRYRGNLRGSFTGSSELSLEDLLVESNVLLVVNQADTLRVILMSAESVNKLLKKMKEEMNENTHSHAVLSEIVEKFKIQPHHQFTDSIEIACLRSEQPNIEITGTQLCEGVVLGTVIANKGVKERFFFHSLTKNLQSELQN